MGTGAARPDVEALRLGIARLSQARRAGPSGVLPFGVPPLDAGLPGGGLALGTVHEVFAGGPAVEHGAAPALFAAAALARRPGPVLWIAAQRDIYPPALARAGLDPGRVVFIETQDGALRAMEESLRHPGLAGVVCELEGPLSLVASRRLLLAAEAGAGTGAGALGFVLRRSRRFGDPALTAPSAAATRWRITALPSPPPLPHLPGVPGLGHPLWQLELLRCRGGEAATLIVEGPDATGRLAVPAHLADRPLAPAWARRAGGGPARGAAAGHARA